MIKLTPRRCGVAVTVFLGLLPALVCASAQSTFKTEYFNGKVVTVASWLEKQGVKSDSDSAHQVLALVTEDGKLYMLVKDDSSRMFFKDKTLLNRPMRLTGRLLPQSHLLQVVNVHSYVQGQLHEVYYWCDTCSIRALEPGDCACCQAPLVLRETPVR
jgi:hypothetical protein